MDLNYLLARHQRSVHAAGSAASPEARSSHRGMARGYATRIRDLQQQSGAAAVLGCRA